MKEFVQDSKLRTRALDMKDQYMELEMAEPLLKKNFPFYYVKLPSIFARLVKTKIR